MKEACRKFEEATNIRVAVKLRAGRSLKSDAKSEPLRRADCNREDCLCCAQGKPAAKRLERQQCTMEKAAEMPTLEGWSIRTRRGRPR